MSRAGSSSPREVLERFYRAEAAYMEAGGGDAGASFADLAATLDSDVMLHQSPDLPWAANSTATPAMRPGRGR